MNDTNKGLKDFYILWTSQSLSQLGSAMTGFALTLWLYEKTGSALSTAALTICTYAPYVIMSIFAGAISDRYDKKTTMLVCDALAAFTTILVFVLYRTDALSILPQGYRYQTKKRDRNTQKRPHIRMKMRSF